MTETVQPAEQPNSSNTSTITYATFLQRLEAYMIDGGIFVIIIWFLDIFMNITRDTGAIAAFMSLIIGFLKFVFFIAYYGRLIYLTGKDGQTPGKKVVGIKVVKVDTHEAPGMTTALLRETIGRLISILTFNINDLWMLWDDKKQTLRDKIANTIVIKSKSSLPYKSVIAKLLSTS